MNLRVHGGCWAVGRPSAARALHGRQTAVARDSEQLHSHLSGALNAGASFGQIEGVALHRQSAALVDQWKKIKELWRTVREGWSPGN